MNHKGCEEKMLAVLNREPVRAWSVPELMAELGISRLSITNTLYRLAKKGLAGNSAVDRTPGEWSVSAKLNEHEGAKDRRWGAIDRAREQLDAASNHAQDLRRRLTRNSTQVKLDIIRKHIKTALDELGGPS